MSRSLCVFSWLCATAVCLSMVGCPASASLVMRPYTDGTCEQLIPSLPDINLPNYAIASGSQCVAYTSSISAFSAQPPLWLSTSCNDSYSYASTVKFFYYSVNGLCPSTQGNVGKYPANITYSTPASNTGNCGALSTRLVNATGALQANAWGLPFCNSSTSTPHENAAHTRVFSSTSLLLALCSVLAALLLTH